MSYIFFLLSVQKYSNFENITVHIHSQDIFKYILMKTIYKSTEQNITIIILLVEKYFTLTFKSDKICFLKTSIFTFIHIGI